MKPFIPVVLLCMVGCSTVPAQTEDDVVSSITLTMTQNKVSCSSAEVLVANHLADLTEASKIAPSWGVQCQKQTMIVKWNPIDDFQREHALAFTYQGN